jgi:hypothetical protein
MGLLLLCLFSAAAVIHADHASFDCTLKQLAVEYAQQIQPWRPQGVFEDVAAALNAAPPVGPACNVTPSYDQPAGLAPLSPVAAALAAAAKAPGATFYADPVSGSDSNPGTITAPFATIGKASWRCSRVLVGLKLLSRLWLLSWPLLRCLL